MIAAGHRLAQQHCRLLRLLLRCLLRVGAPMLRGGRGAAAVQLAVEQAHVHAAVPGMMLLAMLMLLQLPLLCNLIVILLGRTRGRHRCVRHLTTTMEVVLPRSDGCRTDT